jgi:tetratricopeptide (TPR) repeat protein
VSRLPAAVLTCGIACVMAAGAATPVTGRAAPIRGLTAAPQVARAYDAVLNADFEQVPTLLAQTCGPAPRAACLAVRAMATWWDIQLDPHNTALDTRFSAEVEAAVHEAERWTRREPERAEAWFYQGVALGARSQWKVLRNEHLSAARDGKRIKEVLERALDLDPGMDDAAFGIGVYRYYAAIAPSYLRMIRWLLLLPGGDREEGLAQMERTSRQGQLARGEADYQLQLAYLWYEERFDDALALVLDLQSRYPRNPLFRHLEATIRDVYFHDHERSLAASEALVAAAARGEVNRPGLATVRARLNIALQLDQLGQRDRARLAIDTLLAGQPTAPADAIARARELKRAWSAR